MKDIRFRARHKETKKYNTVGIEKPARCCPVFPNCSEDCGHIEYDVDGGYYCHFEKQWIIPNL